MYMYYLKVHVVASGRIGESEGIGEGIMTARSPAVRRTGRQLRP
jgi:hypothetical protein